MNDLVDMKLPAKSKKDTMAVPCEAERELYPYGLKLTFDKEQIAKLPELDGAKVGDTVTVEATGTIVAVRISERKKENPDHTVEIQIENISIEASTAEPDKAEETDEEATVSKMHSRRKNW
jgi:hypothetical protein